MNIAIGLIIAGLVIGLIVFAMTFKNTEGLEPIITKSNYEYICEYGVFENNLGEYILRYRNIHIYDGKPNEGLWQNIKTYTNKDEALNEMTYRIAKQNATEKRIA